MYWLQPPPYARWGAAALLVIGAFWWDVRGMPLEPHPVAAHDLDAGTALGDGDIRWIDLPAGAYPIPDLTGARMKIPLSAGEPVSKAVLVGEAVIPDDWWVIPVELSAPTAPGDSVLLAILDPPTTLAGIVIEPQRGDRISLDHRPALVAVPGEMAVVVAAADAAGLLVAAVRPPGP